ncbi:unnamed protein product [Moneuplotes crassus]|uniref:PHD-type domain-containing protein n=1 Tax=Euplotes crassus TaxID=5936 RepID=A0AAD1XM78_EUPCR|nr:unnamed protein product [Moneuplotes crassus]
MGKMKASKKPTASSKKKKDKERLPESVSVKKPKKTVSENSSKKKISKKKDIEKLDNFTKSYEKVRYKDIEIKVGDYIQVQDENTGNYVAKVLVIIKHREDSEPDDPEKLVKLVATRFFQKKDIDMEKCDIPNEMSSSIADNEVFSSNHNVIIPAHAVFARPEVMLINDYQNLSITGQNTYYTRAKYDIIKRQLDPPFKNWPQFCVCKKPLNPNSLYIGCETCDRWFHPLCVKIDPVMAKEMEKYYCEFCNKASKKKVSKKSKEKASETTSSKSKSKKKETTTKANKGSTAKAKKASKRKTRR